MVSVRDTKKLLGSKSPLAKLQLLLIAGVVALSGGYLVTHIYAASGSLTFVPGQTSTNVNIGDQVVVAIRENSGTDPVNAVQANVTYDATKLQYVSVSETGSAFGLAAFTSTNSGSLQFARGTTGGTPPVTGNQLVTTVTFKALAAGAAPLTFATGSVLARSTDAVDILAVKNNITLNVADLAAPTVPTGLTGNILGMSTVPLSWTASTDNVGVTGYRIYRDGTQVGTSAITSFNDTGLAAGSSHTYKVAAVDAAGNLSAQSAGLVVTTAADLQAPTVPGKPTSTIQTMTTITIGWTASTDNVAVTGYRVYRNGTLVASPTTTSFADSGLTVATPYSYTVAAIDGANNLSPQSAATAVSTLADTVAPSVPTGLHATVSGSNVQLTWTASTDNVKVTTYFIYRDGTQIVSIASTTAAYTVTGAPKGTHTYSVAAGDAALNKSAQSAVVTTQIFIQGDINKDGKVDVFDLSALLSNWAKTGVNTSDLNGDSTVNVFDLSILLSKWTG